MKVRVDLIFGHKAERRDQSTPEGYTHDWEIYVKGDQGNIEAFVDCVIFYLHESFPKPKRVIKKPPYMVKESGYAGFILNIEILFKNKETRKANFQYDLYLPADKGPITPFRKEKLIFRNPNEEFTSKLLKGGGQITSLDKSGQSRDKSSSLKHSGGTASTSHSSSGNGGKSAKHSLTVPPNPMPSAKTSPKNSFETLFGTPIKRSSNNSQSSAVSSFGSLSSSNSSISSKPSKEKSSSKEKVGRLPVDKVLSKPAKSPLPPGVDAGGSNSKPVSMAKSKSTTSSKPTNDVSAKPIKEKDSSKKKSEKRDMLPPSKTSVPKKAKKPEKERGSLNDLASSSSSTVPPMKEKTKKDKTKTSSKVKLEPLLPVADEEMVVSKTDTKDPVHSKISSNKIRDKSSSKKHAKQDSSRKHKRNEKVNLSPISSSSSESSGSSVSSSTSSLSASASDGEAEINTTDSSKKLATSSTSLVLSDYSPKPSPTSSSSLVQKKRSKKSQSRSPRTSMLSPAPSPSSSASSVTTAGSGPATSSSSSKKRKHSSSHKSYKKRKNEKDIDMPTLFKEEPHHHHHHHHHHKHHHKKKSKSKKEPSSTKPEKVSKGQKQPAVYKEDDEHLITSAISPMSHTWSKGNKKSHVTVSPGSALSPSGENLLPTSSSNGTSPKKNNRSKSSHDKLDDERPMGGMIASKSPGMKRTDSHDDTMSSSEDSSEDSSDDSEEGEVSYNEDEMAVDSNVEELNEANSSGVPHSGFSHAGVAGTITAEMKLLRDLHDQISKMDNPMKLQEVVDIVESCGSEFWTKENGVTFDFDLCKLSHNVIHRLKEIVFDAHK